MKRYLVPVIALIVAIYLHATQLKIYDDEKDFDNPPIDTGPVWLRADTLTFKTEGGDYTQSPCKTVDETKK